MRSGVGDMLGMVPVLGLLGLAGCMQLEPRAEWDELACRDGLDNDHDGLIDCKDPDCWAFTCQPASSGGSGAGVGADGQLGTSAGSGVSPLLLDAQVPSAAAALDAQTDGGMRVDSTDCGPGEDCDSGSPTPCSGPECPAEPALNGPIAGDYKVEVISAVVPDRSNLTSLCFDADLDALCISSCTESCLPDPYVVIMQNSVRRVGATPSATDTTLPRWSRNNTFSVTLRTEADVLTFRVLDADPNPLGVTPVSTDIFSCTPDLQRQIPLGLLSCAPANRVGFGTEEDATYNVVAKISKVP